MRAAAFAPLPGRGRDQQGRGRHVAQSDAAGAALDRGEACARLRASPSPSRITPTCARHHRCADRFDGGRHRGDAARDVTSASGRRAGAAIARPAMSSAMRAGIDHGLQQRVRRQPVGAMRAGRGDFAAGPQARRASCGRARPPRCRPCGNARPARSGSARVAGSMPARDAACIARSETCRRTARRSPARASRKAPRPAAISANTPRATMSRGASSACGWTRAHEAFAVAVDQRRAFAAQRFGCERRRIAADVMAVGWNCTNSAIGDHGAGARRDGKARRRWLRPDWWSPHRDAPMPPVASTTRARREQSAACRGDRRPRATQAGDARRPRSAALRRRNLRSRRIDGVRAHGLDQRRDDRARRPCRRCTCTMRRAECAASGRPRSRPSRSRSNGTP